MLLSTYVRTVVGYPSYKIPTHGGKNIRANTHLLNMHDTSIGDTCHTQRRRTPQSPDDFFLNISMCDIMRRKF